jgi:hypothetical protein
MLKTLNLSKNGLSGAECGRAWLNALKANTTLVELDLRYVGIVNISESFD